MRMIAFCCAEWEVGTSSSTASCRTTSLGSVATPSVERSDGANLIDAADLAAGHVNGELLRRPIRVRVLQQLLQFRLEGRVCACFAEEDSLQGLLRPFLLGPFDDFVESLLSIRILVGSEAATDRTE